MKEAKRDMEIMLMVLSNLVVLAQKWYGVLRTLDVLSGFFIDFAQKKGPKGTWKFY